MRQPAAIVKQIDHLLIASRDPQALYALFTERLGLPVTWAMREMSDFVSGGVFCGNVDLEFLKLKPTDDFTALLGIAFEPSPLEQSIPELASRGIIARASVPFEGTLPDGTQGVLWRNVTLPWFLGESMIFLCARAPYAKERRARLEASFDGGALGINAVRCVMVGTTDLNRTRQKWDDLLDPVPMRDPDTWQAGAGPAITLVEHPCNRLVRLEIAVESLAKAREFLAGNDLLGDASSTELTLKPAAVDGLDIRFVGA
jgi:hypothetical protein